MLLVTSMTRNGGSSANLSVLEPTLRAMPPFTIVFEITARTTARAAVEVAMPS